jgi:LysM repeat protein
MNTPSPLIPQGATPPRPKNSLYFKILMVLSVHVVVIGGMLLQGCKDTSAKDQVKSDGSPPVSSDTSSVSTPPVSSPPAPAPTDTPPVTNPSLVSTAPTSAVPTIPSPQPAPPSANLAPSMKSTDLVPPGEAKEYVIAKGDTMAAIAHKNGLSLKALMEANPGVNAKKLQIGQKVQIPAATTALATTAGKDAAPGASAETASADGTVYVVKSGDMLLKIAKAHGTTVKKIMAMNELKSTSIRAGQKLKLPAAKTSSTEPAATTTASAALTPPMKVSAATPTPGAPVAAN